MQYNLAALEIFKNTTHFSYRIEEKPDGGFIARSSDPGMEPLEGATREEVLQKIQAKATAMASPNLSDKGFKFGGFNVTVNRKFSYTSIPAKTGVAATDSPTDQKALREAEQSFSSPVERSSDTTGTMLRVLAAVIALGALLYFFLHR